MTATGTSAPAPEVDVDVDVVVVGSGFGGSVAALRLAEKGYRVARLEAGRRFEDEDFAADVLGRCGATSGRRGWAATASSASTGCPTSSCSPARASAAARSTTPTPSTCRRTPFFQRPRSGPTSPTGRRELAPHYETASAMLGVVDNPCDGLGRAAHARHGRRPRRRRHLPQDPGRRLLRRRPGEHGRPTPTSAAPARRAPAAPSAATAWSAAGSAPRTRSSRTTSRSPRTLGVTIEPLRTVTRVRPLDPRPDRGCRRRPVPHERAGPAPGASAGRDGRARWSSRPGAWGTAELLHAHEGRAGRAAAAVRRRSAQLTRTNSEALRRGDDAARAAPATST